MTPKEKSIELVYDFFDAKAKSIDYVMEFKKAIQCALIAIDKIYSNNTDESKNDYWIEVKQELNKIK